MCKDTTLVQSCVQCACNIIIWCDLFFPASGREGEWKNHEAGAR